MSGAEAKSSPSPRGRGLGGGGGAASLAPSPQPPPARGGGVFSSPPLSLAPVADFLSTTWGRVLARLVLALILLAMWEYLPSADLRFWMSGPVEIVTRLWSWILDGSLWENVGAT